MPLYTKLMIVVIALAHTLALFHIWIMVRRMCRQGSLHITDLPLDWEAINKRRREVATAKRWNQHKAKKPLRNAHHKAQQGKDMSNLLAGLGLGKKKETDKPKDEDRPIIITHTLP